MLISVLANDAASQGGNTLDKLDKMGPAPVPESTKKFSEDFKKNFNPELYRNPDPMYPADGKPPGNERIMEQKAVSSAKRLNLFFY